MNFAVGKYHDDHNSIRYNHDPTIFYGNISFEFFKAGKDVTYPSSYKVFYNAALRKAVESIYRKDLILYGYTFWSESFVSATLLYCLSWYSLKLVHKRYSLLCAQ